MKKLLVSSIIGIILFTSFVSANSTLHYETIKYNNEINLESNGFINITALEAWNLMNNPDDIASGPIYISSYFRGLESTYLIFALLALLGASISLLRKSNRSSYYNAN